MALEVRAASDCRFVSFWINSTSPGWAVADVFLRLLAVSARKDNIRILAVFRRIDNYVACRMGWFGKI